MTFRDIDVLGHINNAVYVTWFEAARTAYIMELCALKRLEDLPVILAETTIRYIAQGEFGETVVIGTGVSRWGTKSFDLAYGISTTTGRVLATGRSVQVYYDYESRKTVPIPQQFRGVVADRQGGWTPRRTSDSVRLPDETPAQNHMTSPAAIGVIGLGVMGRNLALNFAGKGISVAAFDRADEARAALASAAKPGVTVAADIAALVGALARPRAILLMIPAGAPVDDQIAALTPLLEKGDVVIDGGNSHYRDTARREAALAARGIHFLGMGVSGGEEGALAGPALMVGGAKPGYTHVAKLLTTIAAHSGDQACCDYVGAGGAGHFVKMVHNGIEYADMQLIAEAHFILSRGLKLADAHIGAVFRMERRSAQLLSAAHHQRGAAADRSGERQSDPRHHRRPRRPEGHGAVDVGGST